MNKVIVLFLMTLLASCGEPVHYREDRGEVATTYAEDDFVVIGRATVTITSRPQLRAVASTPVIYVSPETNQFVIDSSGLVPSEGDNVVDLGEISITQVRVNNLIQCGGKCDFAGIRIYTEELPSYPGVEGFVNTYGGYGAPVRAGELSPSLPVGLGPVGAAMVDSYPIPSNDNKLTLSDFSVTTYQLDVDFANAGAGTYEMTLIIELVLGATP